MTPDEFRDMIEAVALASGDTRLAAKLLVSTRAVGDWKAGSNLPPPSLRAVYRDRLVSLGWIPKAWAATTERTPRDVVTERERNAETLECMLAAVAGGALVAAGLLIAWAVTS